MCEIYIPSTQQDKDEIKGAMESIVTSMIRKDSENDNIKEIKKMLKENFDLKPAVVGKIATLMYKQTKEEYFGEQRDLETFYDAIVKDGSGA